MATSTFTPIEGASVVLQSYWDSELFVDRYRVVTLAAGAQLLIQNFSDLPIFVTSIQPLTPDDLLSGFLIPAKNCEIAVPYVGTLYVCFPYGDGLASVSSGALTANNSGPVEGPELVTNGNFAQGETGWTLGTGWTIANGLASKTAGTTSDLAQNAIVPVPGATYRIRYTLNWTAGIFRGRIGNVVGVGFSASGNYTEDITASNTLPFTIRGGSTAAGSVTNISVKQLM